MPALPRIRCGQSGPAQYRDRPDTESTSAARASTRPETPMTETVAFERSHDILIDAPPKAVFD